MAKLFTDEKGHSLIETLIALAILIAVLVPLSQLFVRLILNETSRDLMIASQIARGEMERTIARQEYSHANTTISVNNKSWKCVRDIENNKGLVKISISVFKGDEPDAIVQLKTLRLNPHFEN
ncbi:MAG: hypothetical protein V2J62_09930 [candidate division KSB1 bacterium]|jgi:Tfp pilus assembly protein PilV|nr:hypothetical protein [candidate division KSB1 bacterium]